MKKPKTININKFDRAVAVLDAADRELDAEWRRARELDRLSFLTDADRERIAVRNAGFRRRLDAIKRRYYNLSRAADLYNGGQ